MLFWSRLVIIKKLRETLEDLVPEHENKAEFLQSVLDFLTQGNGEKVIVDTNISATAQYEQAKKDDYEDRHEKFKIMMETQTKLLEEAEKKVNTTKQTATALKPGAAETLQDVYNSMLKREFKKYLVQLEVNIRKIAFHLLA